MSRYWGRRAISARELTPGNFVERFCANFSSLITLYTARITSLCLFKVKTVIVELQYLHYIQCENKWEYALKIKSIDLESTECVFKCCIPLSW